MHKPFEIIQVGLGPMGKIITSLLLKRQNILLRGVVDIDPQLVEKKLSDLVDINKDIDLGYELFSQFVDVYPCDTMKDISKRLLTVQISMIEKVIKGIAFPKRIEAVGHKPHTMMDKKTEQDVLKVFKEYKETYRK